MGANGYAKDVLVSTDWVADHLGRRARRRRRGRREPRSLRRGPHPRRREAALARRPAGPDRARHRRQGVVRARCSARAASATTPRSSSTATATTGSPPTPTGTSRSTATRTCGSSTAAGRSGSTRARELTTETPAPAAATYTADDRDESIRAYRDYVREAIGDDGQGARRRPLAAGVRGRAARAARLRAGGRLSAAGTSRARSSIPWAQAVNDDGTFKGADALRELYGGQGRHAREGDDRLLPDRRALGAHLVRPARAARLRRTSATTTAPGPSGATSSTSRSRREPRAADRAPAPKRTSPVPVRQAVAPRLERGFRIPSRSCDTSVW